MPEHETHLRKLSPLPLLLLLLLVTNASVFRLAAAATTAADKDDAAAMAKLAKSLTPTPSGWTGSNPCTWTSVTCDSSGRVTAINLASKSLGGELPSELNLLSNLKTLSLQRNRIRGPLPSLSNLPSLQQVYLDNNNFTSVPSPFLSGLTSLQTLSLSENHDLPPWTLPETLADSTTLTTLYIGNSQLMGTLPDIFASFPNLQSIRLSYNNLTGPLPPSFAKSGIQNLWLNDQVGDGFSGRLDVLALMPQLTQVWLHGNKFSGPIPDLNGLTNLFDLSLRDNGLTGPIPLSLTTLPKLVNVSLQNNKLQGPIPSFPTGVQVNLGVTNNFCNPKPGPCDSQVNTLLEVAGALGYPMTLAESWSGNNPCDGWKSVSCDSKGSVSVINFGKQGWVGTISPAIANLTGLTTLLLNDNNLTGTIPPGLTKLAQLKLLDISNNNISGVVPAFGSGVTIKTSGNPFLGKIVSTGNGTSSSSNNTSPSGSPSTGTSSGSSSSSGGSGTTVAGTHKSSTSPWVIVGSIVASVIVIVALSLVIYKLFVKKRSGKYKWARKGKEKSKKGGAVNGSGSEMLSQSSGETQDGGTRVYTIEVLREVTDNFSEGNILGRGGFGVVYRGQLQEGTQIAVKRMEGIVSSSKGLSEFQAEIGVLSRVRHRHLVALQGFCINGNERLLVYEYMSKGTLGQHLFSYREMGVSPLTWKQRISIALDVARGVEYLHTLTKECFIHRDLKPSNILLDDDMRAKVSDFGLVKSTPDDKFSIETRLAGTFGYLAPEYAATGRVTTKVDVFAFGVVLMEIITGKKALGDTPDEGSNLVTWFRKEVLSDNKVSIRKSVDPTLDPDEETFETICTVTELAGHCTAREPSQRPDMSHVVTVFSPLVDQWRPTTQEEESFVGGISFAGGLPQAIDEWKLADGTSRDYGYTYTSTPGESSSSVIGFGLRDGR